MATTNEIIAQQVILVAKNINVGAFSQYWFMKNGVFGGEEFLEDSVFTPGLTVVSTKECQLMILPDQIRFGLKIDDLTHGEEYAASKLGAFFKAFTDVKIEAVGLNFVMRIIDPDRTTGQLSRDLFHRKDTNLGGYFSNKDAYFGAYISQDHDAHTRLKLDIKPVHTMDGDTVTEFLMASFNFHRDIIVKEDLQQALLEQLAKWHEFVETSMKVSCLLS